jgi:hypothetical protein
MYMGENTLRGEAWVPYDPCHECGSAMLIERADHTWIVKSDENARNGRTVVRGENIEKSIVCRNCDRVLSATGGV